MNFDIQADITPEDLTAYWNVVSSNELARLGRMPQTRLTANLPIAIVAFGLGTIVIGAIDGQLDYSTLIRCAIVIAGLALVWFRIRPVPLDDTSVSLGRHRISVNDCEIRDVVGDHHEVRTAWPGVRSVHKTPDHMLVLVDRRSGYVIPTRAFLDEAQVNLFWEAITERHQQSAPRSAA